MSALPEHVMRTHRIDEVRLHRVESRVDLRYSTWSRSTARAMVVEVRSGAHTGWGEFNDFTWRRFFPAERTALGMARRIIGRDATTPSRSLRWLPALPVGGDPWSRGEQRQWLNVREGLSMALYDLAGHIAQLPAASLLRGAVRSEAPGMPVIHVNAPEEMARVARFWVASMGFRYLKLKLTGHDDSADAARLEAVRDAVGEGVALQIDYNYGFRSAADVIRVVNQHHARFHIDVVEDPIRPQYLGLARLMPYPRLRREVEPQVMLDGPAYWPNIKRVVRAHAADLVNHHADRQGGLDLGLRVSQYAEAHGIRSAIGSGGGVCGVKDRAMLVLASVAGLSRPCETIGWPLYAAPDLHGYYGVTAEGDLTGTASARVRTDGMVSLPLGPGLGFAMDEDALQRSRVGAPLIVRSDDQRRSPVGASRS